MTNAGYGTVNSIVLSRVRPENFRVLLDNSQTIGYIEFVKLEFAAGGLTMAERAEKVVARFCDSDALAQKGSYLK